VIIEAVQIDTGDKPHNILNITTENFVVFNFIIYPKNFVANKKAPVKVL